MMQTFPVVDAYPGVTRQVLSENEQLMVVASPDWKASICCAFGRNGLQKCGGFP